MQPNLPAISQHLRSYDHMALYKLDYYSRCCFYHKCEFKVHLFRQGAATNCAVLPTANAGQYAPSNCLSLLFWFPCNRRNVWISNLQHIMDGNYRIRGTENKKLSYRRETARQLPTWREGGARPSSPLPLHPLSLHPCVWLNPKATTYVRQACRP